MTRPDPDPLYVDGDDISYLKPASAYLLGHDYGYRHRRWRQLAAAVAIGIVAGLLVGNLLTKAATPRSAPDASIPVVVQTQTGAPQRVVSGATPEAIPVQGPATVAPQLIPPACSGPCPTLTPRPRATPRVLLVRTGIATTYGPGWDGWIAWPDGPGWRLRICGPSACTVRVSNDAGPSLAGQRMGRVIDLDVSTFELVCGVPWRRGYCDVSVQVLG